MDTSENVSSKTIAKVFNKPEEEVKKMIAQYKEDAEKENAELICIRDVVNKMIEEKISEKTIAKIINKPEEEVKKMIAQYKENAKPNNKGK